MYYIYDRANPNVPYLFNDGPAIFESKGKATFMAHMMNVVDGDGDKYAVAECE